VTKAYRIVRQSPTDLDDESPAVIGPPQFDYQHRGGATPWPERHRFSGVKFGPRLVKAAWKAGLIVLAEIDGFPHPVAVKEARWTGGVFEVETLDGPRIPRRIFTRTDIRGLRSTGEYIE
jgi:hypothetical protein